MLSTFEYLGSFALKSVHELGMFGLFCRDVFFNLINTRLKLQKVFYYASQIGIDSFEVVALTGSAVGGVLAFHSYHGLSRFGADQFIGPIVFLAMAREFGPVLSALMVTGRAGSAMTAEIGSMKITEQIDALSTMGINVHQYLIIPRLIASIIMMPILSIFCVGFGAFVGYLIAVNTLGINSELYLESIRANVVIWDLTQGMIKAIVFGGIFSMVACYKGITTAGGARGVGTATTTSVVYASVTVLIVDYIMTSFMSIM